jgi:hypothetical protein
MSILPGSDDRTQAELLDNLRYGTQDEQEQALERLTAVGEAEALDAVVEHLCEHPAHATKAALDALRVLANKYMPVDRYSLAEALIPYLESNDWEKRLGAARLLNAHPNELAVEPLRDLVYDARQRVYEERGRRTSTARMLAERTLGEGIMALANCGRLLALPDILELLEDPALQIVATRALGVIGSETERLTLDELCEHADPRVRDAAQWGLGLMDERAEQFMNPPAVPPEPPPDRLSPVYWTHRQLEADAADDLLQFLIVRVAIEHLMLDEYLSEGRVPERCTIMVRRYAGATPPERQQTAGEPVGIWEYSWYGPTLRRRTAPPRPGHALRGRSGTITIIYPEDLPYDGTGLVSFECRLGSFSGEGWIYRVERRGGEWMFARQRRSWSG